MSTRRLTPADFTDSPDGWFIPPAVSVRAVTIARAGRNRFGEIRLFFVETGPDLYYQPNETGVTTLQQFLGAPGRAWVGRCVVVALKQETHPDANAARSVVAIGTPRQWYDILGLALPALADNS